MPTYDKAILERHSAELEKHLSVGSKINQGPVRFSWQHTPENSGRHRTQATWSRGEDNPSTTLSLQDEQKVEIGSIEIPDPDTAWNMVIIPSICFLALENVSRNGHKLYQHLIYLDSSPAAQSQSIKILTAVKEIVRKLPVNQVPYFNLGGRRSLPSNSSLVSYNLRQPQIAVQDPNIRPWALYFGATDTCITYTNWLACVEIRQLLTEVSGGRMEVPASSAANRSVLAVRELTLKPALEAPIAHEAMSTPTTCAECGEGESPSDFGAVKNKLKKKEWVGCHEGENCKSRNFWFHFGCCDCDFKMVKNKVYWWFCPECRTTPRSKKLHDGKYIKPSTR